MEILKRKPPDQKCQLNHENDPNGTPSAVGTLDLSPPTPENEEPLVIQYHVCQECMDWWNQEQSERTRENDWILLICAACCSTQWAHRWLTRLRVEDDCKVVWFGYIYPELNGAACPRCLADEWAEMERKLEETRRSAARLKTNLDGG